VVAGSDKVVQVLDPAWYEDRDAALGAMFEAAGVLYAVREGDEQGLERTLSLPENVKWKGCFRRLPVRGDVARISSRTVRSLLREGRDVSSLVPLAVREILGDYR
jgi:hypothetical protein